MPETLPTTTTTAEPGVVATPIDPSPYADLGITQADIDAANKSEPEPRKPDQEVTGQLKELSAQITPEEHSGSFGPSLSIEQITEKALKVLDPPETAGKRRGEATRRFFSSALMAGYSRAEAKEAVPAWVKILNKRAPKDSYGESTRYTYQDAYADLDAVYGKEKKSNEVDELLALCKDFEYFRCGVNKTPFIRLTVDNADGFGKHKEVYETDWDGGGHIERILLSRFHKAFNQVPPKESMTMALRTIAARCLDAPERGAYVRFARRPDKVYIDMCDANWRAIKITRDGWEVVQDHDDVLFWRPEAALPLPEPARDGSLDLLRPLLNAREDDHWVLMVAWLLGVLLPKGPMPHLVVEGTKGSAKTSTCLALRNVLDLCKGPLNGAPRSIDDAIVSLRRKGIGGFDNLSGLGRHFSDFFCMCSTGQLYERRTLYQTLGNTMVELHIPLVINGIDSTVMQPDLLDRSIVLTLPMIEPQDRQEEETMSRRFDEAHGKVLGALLNAAVVGMRELPNVRTDEKPRMADFFRWMIACEKGLNWPTGTFARTYLSLIEAQSRDLAQRDPLAAALIEWATKSVPVGEPFEIVSSSLLYQLNNDGLRERDKEWPKSPEALAHKLRRIQGVLKDEGLMVAKGKHTKTGTPWVFQWTQNADLKGTTVGAAHESLKKMDPKMRQAWEECAGDAVRDKIAAMFEHGKSIGLPLHTASAVFLEALAKELEHYRQEEAKQQAEWNAMSPEEREQCEKEFKEACAFLSTISVIKPGEKWYVPPSPRDEAAQLPEAA